MPTSISQKKGAAANAQVVITQFEFAKPTQPAVVWELQAYQKVGDELVDEWPLKGISTETLHHLFEQPEDNPMYDAYPVTEAQARQLQAYTDHLIDLQAYDYFVECYAE